jgi:hypothetical protein
MNMLRLNPLRPKPDPDAEALDEIKDTLSDTSTSPREKRIALYRICARNLRDKADATEVDLFQAGVFFSESIRLSQ